MTARQSSSLMRASTPSRVRPALLTRMSRSPASSTSALRLLGRRDVGLHRAAADLLRERLGLFAPAAVADDDGRARARELGGDRAADSARGAGDERGLSLEGANPLAQSSACSSSSNERRLFTDIDPHALVDPLQ